MTKRLTTEDTVCEAAPKAGHRELLFSLVSSVLSVVFPKPISEDNKKSRMRNDRHGDMG